MSVDSQMHLIKMLRLVMFALVGILLVSDGIFTIILLTQGKDGQAAAGGAFFLVNLVLLAVILRVKMPDLP